jgi:hypothetical protein
MADFNPSMLNAQDAMVTVDDSGLDSASLTQAAAPWMTSVQMPPLASSSTQNAIMRQGQAVNVTNASAIPWLNQNQQIVDPSGNAGPAPYDAGVIMPDEDMTNSAPGRTDFTQDIDGAFSQRSAGAKHWSEVARSGNGDATSDLDVQDEKDYFEVDGLGEHLECLSFVESTRVDGLGHLANIPKFRWPQLGEVPPYAAAPGKTWVRRRVVTSARQPGGARVAKVKWAQMSPAKVQQSIASGNLPSPGGVAGLGMSSSEMTGISLAAGVAAGLALWFLVLKKKK